MRSQEKEKSDFSYPCGGEGWTWVLFSSHFQFLFLIFFSLAGVHEDVGKTRDTLIVKHGGIEQQIQSGGGAFGGMLKIFFF